MMMFIWAIIALVVVVAAVLIFMEHEWGFVIGGSTVAILVISYFCAQYVVGPLGAMMTRGPMTHLDAMAITALILLVSVIALIAFLAGRGSASRRKR